SDWQFQRKGPDEKIWHCQKETPAEGAGVLWVGVERTLLYLLFLDFRLFGRLGRSLAVGRRSRRLGLEQGRSLRGGTLGGLGGLQRSAFGFCNQLAALGEE